MLFAYIGITVNEMLMVMTIAGNTLVIVDVTVFNTQVWSRGYAVIVLMTVIEGYVADNFVCMARPVALFAGNTRQAVTMLVYQRGFTAKAMTVNGLRHLKHLRKLRIILHITVYAENAQNLQYRYH